MELDVDGSRGGGEVVDSGLDGDGEAADACAAADGQIGDGDVPVVLSAAVDDDEVGLSAARRRLLLGLGGGAPGVSLEVGDGQAEAAVALLRSSMSCSQVFPDYSGRDRIVVGSKADVLPVDHTNPVDQANPVDRTNPVDHTRSEGSDGQDNH